MSSVPSISHYSPIYHVPSTPKKMEEKRHNEEERNKQTKPLGTDSYCTGFLTLD